MSRWSLSKEFRFEASHQLKDHDGKCANLHGHSWRGVLTIRGGELAATGPKRGMLLDYAELTGLLAPWVDKLDHHHLNDVLATDMPTSEFLAMWLFDHLEARVMQLGLELQSVRIEETCTTACAYGDL